MLLFGTHELLLFSNGANAIEVTVWCGADGVPPVLQTRGVPPAAEGLPSSISTPGSYRYVLFHFWFITITRRSLSLAVAASCLTFVALQVGPCNFLSGSCGLETTCHC